MSGESSKYAFDRHVMPTESVDVEVARINSTDFPELKDERAKEWIQQLCRMYKVGDTEDVAIGYHAERTHGRSGVVPSLKLTDTRGLAWEVSVKGMGYVLRFLPKGTSKVKTTHWHASGNGHAVYGIADVEAAEHSWDMYDTFVRLGVRTTIPIAYAPAKTLLVDDVSTPVELIPRRKKSSVVTKSIPYHLVEGQEPVFDIEAFRIKTRHNQITGAYYSDFLGYAEYVKGQVARAIDVVREELGIKNMTIEQYCDWFTDALGESLGRMHAGGFVYRNMYSNVTLDCRFPDRDTVRSFHDLFTENQASIELSIDSKDPDEAVRKFERDTMHADLQFVKHLIQFVNVVRSVHGRDRMEHEAVAKHFQESYARAYCERRKTLFSIPKHATFSEVELSV